MLCAWREYSSQKTLGARDGRDTNTLHEHDDPETLTGNMEHLIDLEGDLALTLEVVDDTMSSCLEEG